MTDLSKTLTKPVNGYVTTLVPPTRNLWPKPIPIRSYYHLVAVYELNLVSGIRCYRKTGLISGLDKDGVRRRYRSSKYIAKGVEIDT